MLSTAEKRKIYARVDRKCAQFEVLEGELVYAGLESFENPFAVLCDNAGEPWKKTPWQMNASDIVEYIECNFGPLFVGFLRDHFNMTEH